MLFKENSINRIIIYLGASPRMQILQFKKANRQKLKYLCNVFSSVIESSVKITLCDKCYWHDQYRIIPGILFAIMVALMAFSESIERLTGAFVSRMVFGKSNLKRHRKNSNIFNFSSRVNIDFV